MVNFRNFFPMTPFALTTPLFYVNDAPHMGSAYPTMAADALSRYGRLRGYPTLFVTGTDEHGQKIQRSAEKSGLPPQAHCDRLVAQFQDLWQKLHIEYDRFSRTTSPQHRAIVTEFYQRVWAQGDIYLERQQGWYCVACEEFKDEKELLAEHKCPIHVTLPCEWRDEPNYFFRLSKYQSRLEQLYQERPDFIQPASRRNEVLGFVSQGLRDFSISRVNLSWGIPVPTDPSHTLYVWFDALLGYISALLAPGEEPTLENAVRDWFPFRLHLIGKDILRFHAIYWPAMLMSAELPLPERVFGHGFLTKDGLKMGKSLGNTLDPFALVNTYGADAVRYFFLREIAFGKDGDFSEKRFVETVNADLANSLGNLLNRSLNMTHKYCGGKVPTPKTQEIQALTAPVVGMAQTLGDRLAASYEALDFVGVCEGILALVTACNKLIDEVAPWKRFKEGDVAPIAELLYTVLEASRLSVYGLSPITPMLSREAYRQLGLTFPAQDSWEHSRWGVLLTDAPLPTPSPLFQRLLVPA
jgi:methionyl-tRNA synthetase